MRIFFSIRLTHFKISMKFFSVKIVLWEQLYTVTVILILAKVLHCQGQTTDWLVGGKLGFHWWLVSVVWSYLLSALKGNNYRINHSKLEFTSEKLFKERKNINIKWLLPTSLSKSRVSVDGLLTSAAWRLYCVDWKLSL